MTGPARPAYGGHQELIDSELLKNYNAAIIKLILNAQDARAETVLDFGAGIGTLCEEYEKQTAVKPAALELDDYQRSIIKQKGFDAYRDVDDVIDRRFDVIYSSNVLEHIEDDVGMLKRLKLILHERGTLCIYVPAFMCLWAGLDARVGHFRRYSANELLGKLRVAGYSIKTWQYCDSLGFFASFFFGRFGNADGIISDRSWKLYDKVFTVSNRLDELGLKKLFGKNLFVAAKPHP